MPPPCHLPAPPLEGGTRSPGEGPGDVFALPVPGGVLLVSPLRSVTAFVNGAAVRAIRDDCCGTDALRSLVAALNAPAQLPRPPTGSARPAFLGLLPTRNCNLSCVYCGFGAASAARERMSVETAVAAVDWMADSVQAAGGKTLEVHFFGGEPLMAAEVIDVAVHRARVVAARLDLTPHFEISTNGVCSESRAHFLGDYFNAVVLSLDGPREVHDRYRPMGRRGSFDAVVRTALALRGSGADLCLRTCVTQESVTALEDAVRWFCEAFQPSAIDVETIRPTAESEAAGLTPPDPCTFARCFARAHAVAHSYGVDMIYAAAETRATRATFCPVGRDTVIVSPDGRLSSCYLPSADWKRRGLDLDVGRIGDDGTVRVDEAALERLRALVAEKPARCARCFCRSWCAGGCHVNQSYPGCPGGYDDFCVQTRLITAHGLLEDAGAANAAEALFASPETMGAFANRSSDRIDDFVL